MTGSGHIVDGPIIQIRLEEFKYSCIFSPTYYEVAGDIFYFAPSILFM